MDDSTRTEQITQLRQALLDTQGQLQQSRAEAHRIAHSLGERVKELTCLYEVSSLLQQSIPVEALLQQVVDALPRAWQYPEVTVARITLRHRAYLSPGFRDSPWRQATTLEMEGSDAGVIELFYLEPRPPAAEGPFLREERQLIEAVADMISRHLHRRQVEDALRASESKYRTLVENLYEGIWLVDSNYITTFANTRIAEMLGYTVGEMLGRNAFDFVSQTDHETASRRLAIGRTGQREIYEFPLMHKNGQPVWARVAATPLFDAHGNYEGALAGIVDITGRKRAEAALEESEERYRRQAAELETIYWWAPVGLAVFDTELRFIRVNRRLAEINNLPAEEHVGKTLFEVAPGIATQASQIWKRVMDTGEPALKIEFSARSPQEAGTGRCWNSDWLPLGDSTGHIWGINVVVEEITEDKQREEALYRREQEFEALAERSPDIIARIDREWRFLYVNRAVEALTGLGPDWFIGKGLDELPLSPHNKVLRKRAVEAVFDYRLEQTLEHTYETEDGIRYFYARLVPEFDREGDVKSVLVVDRDITDLKRVQHALEELTLHDPLTGVANRRYLEQFIAREWRRGARHRYDMALIMVDIDHFKPYNDRFGHPRGDECLRRVAQALEGRLHRPSDLLVRYGGEEFLIVLPETRREIAMQMAEEMRLAIAALGLDHPASAAGAVVTASFGVAAAPAVTCTFETLLAAADQALYQAKQGGRNRAESRDVACGVAPVVDSPTVPSSEREERH